MDPEPPTRPPSRGEPLPDPEWLAAPRMCLNCGYSLEGLDAPGVCPECSTPFEERYLVLAGLVRRARTPVTPRGIALVMIGILLAIALQLWPLGFMAMGRLFLYAMGALLVLFIALLLTRPRSGKGEGTRRLVCGMGGIALVPLRGVPTPGMLGQNFVPWGGATDVRLRRVSAAWKVLQVRGIAPNGALRTIFEAGVRCPDDAAAHVVEAMRSLMHGRSPDGSGAAASDAATSP